MCGPTCAAGNNAGPNLGTGGDFVRAVLEATGLRLCLAALAHCMAIVRVPGVAYPLLRAVATMALPLVGGFRVWPLDTWVVGELMMSIHALAIVLAMRMADWERPDSVLTYVTILESVGAGMAAWFLAPPKPPQAKN